MATEDGSLGTKGNVIDAMKGQDVLENETLLSKETKVLLEEYDRVTEKAKEILETTDND